MSQTAQKGRSLGLPLALGVATATALVLLAALLWPEEDRRPKAERHVPSRPMVLDEPVGAAPRPATR